MTDQAGFAELKLFIKSRPRVRRYLNQLIFVVFLSGFLVGFGIAAMTIG